MFKSRIPLFFVVCIGLLNGCLEPEGESFRELTDPATVSLALETTPDEIIVLDRPTKFLYTLGGLPFYAQNIEARFGDDKIGTVTRTEDGGFIVDATRIPSGTYQMKIIVTGVVNDGNIASYFSSRPREFSNSYTVEIDSTPGSPLKVIKFEAIGGQLRVFWNRYRKSNFLEYRLLRCQSGNCREFISSSANDTSWIDPDYIGGVAEYYVDLKTQVSTVRGELTTYEWKPNIRPEVNGRDVTIRWGPFPFYNNVESLEATGFPTALSLTDTVIVLPDKFAFGAIANFVLTAVTKAGSRQSFSSSYHAGVLHEMPSVLPRVYNAKEDLYYGYLNIMYSTPSIIVMDANLNEIHREDTHMTLVASANGEYLVAVVDGSIYRLEPRTLQRTLIVSTGSTFMADLQVSNNGLVGCNVAGVFKVFDANSGTEIFSPAGSPSAVLSASGNYIGIRNSNQIYRYDGTSFVQSGTLPANSATFIFDLNDNILAMKNSSGSNYQLNVYDASTLAVIRTIAEESEYVERAVVDPGSGIITYGRSSSSIYNPADGKSVQVGPYLTFTFNGIVFAQTDLYGPFFSIHSSEFF